MPIDEEMFSGCNQFCFFILTEKTTWNGIHIVSSAAYVTVIVMPNDRIPSVNGKKVHIVPSFLPGTTMNRVYEFPAFDPSLQNQPHTLFVFYLYIHVYTFFDPLNLTCECRP